MTSDRNCVEMLFETDNQTRQTENIPYEVAIVGAGISGTALLYSLSRYTNIERILLIEKESEVGLCNSHKTMNSQTLHFGDIETNYTLEKARKVNRAATLVKNYLLRNDTEQKSYSKYHKMVLAIGKEQVAEIRQRHQEFQSLFPQLKLIQRSEIELIEPNLVKGRSPDEEILALYSEAGYAIDFQALARSFLQKAFEHDKAIDTMMATKVKHLKQVGEIYCIQTNRGVFSAKSVVFATGAYSLLFAKSLGYGKDYALLNVAGNFYFSPGILNGKVYTVQIKKIPFAAIHGDAEVHDPSMTRFGPTAKVTLLLEKRKYASIIDYFKTAGLSINAIISFLKILADVTILKYILRNLIYDLPLVGKRLFLKEARKIVPSLKFSELQFAKGYGGIRPQIVNTKTKRLELGEAKIVGKNIVFNITPSPGASTCLQNAEYDSEKIVSFLGSQYTFDRQRFWQDLGDE
jgi:malate dehydrogenase (quinone)